jgi:hypothetical protein
MHPDNIKYLFFLGEWLKADIKNVLPLAKLFMRM